MIDPLSPGDHSSHPLGNSFDGVIFSSAFAPGAQLLGPVKVELSPQHSNLFEVKTELARQVRAKGGNALMNFTYGQRAHRGLKRLAFKGDTESWHGEGDAAFL